MPSDLQVVLSSAKKAVGARAGVVGLGGRGRGERARPRGGREEAPRPSGREEEEAAGSVGGASEGREPRQAERERRVTATAREFAESACVSVGGVERKRPKGLWYRLLLRT
jgi:hypothetical protein